MSLCLPLFLFPPPYIFVPLVSIFLSLYMPLSPRALSCPLCPCLPFSLSLSLLLCFHPISVSLQVSISLSVSVSLGPHVSSLVSLHTCPYQTAQAPGPRWKDLTSQRLQAQDHGCFWDFSSLPDPGPACPAAVSFLPSLLGIPTHPYGALSNQVLEQTPLWCRNCVTTE